MCLSHVFCSWITVVVLGLRILSALTQTEFQCTPRHHGESWKRLQSKKKMGGLKTKSLTVSQSIVWQRKLLRLRYCTEKEASRLPDVISLQCFELYGFEGFAAVVVMWPIQDWPIWAFPLLPLRKVCSSTQHWMPHIFTSLDCRHLASVFAPEQLILLHP